MSRGDLCPACNADLHACRLCEFFDAGASRGCREPVADPPTDKERANFCGYFKPRPGAYAAADSAAAQDALDQLNTLFGDNTDKR